MEFRILGPLEVGVGPQRLDVGGSRQQIVLATLLLGAGSAVTTDRLLAAVYGEDLPPTARSQLQISVSSLRRLFAEHGREGIIATRPPGYVFQVGDDWLDFLRFGELVAAAREAREAGGLEEAVACYRDALRLWRGDALEGLDSPLLQAAAGRLDEQRMAATEDRITLELDLGRHHELTGELAELVEAFPLRERLRGQLMLALYRGSRAADALQVFREARRTMIDELGIEPGAELQRLEQAILRADPALAPPARQDAAARASAGAGPTAAGAAVRQVPRLLPADIADFTGRAEWIRQIRSSLSRAAGDQARLAVPVVSVTGPGGVGKTTLAVHAAHRLAGRFPHGQLFANLHGGGADPVGPMRVLERFLRALGMQGAQIPEGLDERAEAYRDLLAGRRVLVVLDDAAGEAQVLPLLPGSATAAVLVTSRARLAGLPGATNVDLDTFDPDSSTDLLSRIVGAERVRAQASAAMAVAEQCGHLPMALRIAGARLSARPHWSIAHLSERLTDETRRLDELEHGTLAMRASISLSYEGTSDKAQRLLRRLALLEAPVFSGWMGAALLDRPPAEAADLLDELVAAQLVETAGAGTGGDAQYRLHELIRVFARERLAAEEPAAEHKAALQRALGALLYLADKANRPAPRGDFGLVSDAPRWPLPPALTEQLTSDPVAWFERERGVVVSGIGQAARAGLAGVCWSLAFSAVLLFASRAYFDDWRDTHEIALQAARKAHDVRGQAVMLYSLGELHIEQHRYDQGRREHSAALRLFRDVRDAQGMAHATAGIAFVDRVTGRLDDAARGTNQALAVFRSTCNRHQAAFALLNMAMIELERGEVGEARELLAEAMRLARTAGVGRAEAQVLHRMGEAALLTGEVDRAVEAFEQALARMRDLDDLVGEATVLQSLGVAKLRQAEFGHARAVLRRSRELAVAAGQPLTEAQALLGLAELAMASGDPAQAVTLAQQAAEIFRATGAPLFRARALTLLSEAHADAGDTAASHAASAEAAALRTSPGATLAR